jgi:hypothetical protein
MQLHICGARRALQRGFDCSQFRCEERMLGILSFTSMRFAKAVCAQCQPNYTRKRESQNSTFQSTDSI